MNFSGHCLWELTAGGLLVLICRQDWRTRSVSWPAFPLLAGCLLASRLGRESLASIGWQCGGSLLVLSLLLGTLWLYVRLRFRAAGLGLRDQLGSGDVAFWLVLAAYLSPAPLLLFLLGSSLVSLLLLALGGIRPLPGAATTTIPLAGIQAACLLLLLGSQWLFLAGVFPAELSPAGLLALPLAY